MFFADKFMDEEIAEFEIGKRHLANIMSLDADAMTQEDIDVSLNVTKKSFINQCQWADPGDSDRYWLWQGMPRGLS